jgi:hypothetical protein
VKEVGLQNSVLTNRKRIRGYLWWVSEHIFTTHLTNNPQGVDASGIEGRIMLLPEEVFVSTGC